LDNEVHELDEAMSVRNYWYPHNKLLFPRYKVT